MNCSLKVAFFFLSVCVVMLSQSASPPTLVDGVLSDTELGFRHTPPPKMFDETDPARDSVLAALEFSGQPHSYLGFDRNDYPGDDSLNELRKAFDYTGYWLNSPPGAKANTWIGKRKRLQTAGFGFLLLFNGRLYSELKTIDAAAKLGTADAQSAIAAARREGFPDTSIIFLDQEQGGRLLPEQKAYLFAWVDGVSKSGLRAGIYCSGIPAKEGGNSTVTSAQDIRQNAGNRQITYWVTNDACPPAPGCATTRPPSPSLSGITFADVWQYAQSPQRKDVAGLCPGYSANGVCDAPGSGAHKIDVDLNAATSADPSHGRSQD